MARGNQRKTRGRRRMGTDAVDYSELKKTIRKDYPADHPLNKFISTLPDSVSPTEGKAVSAMVARLIFQYAGVQ